MKDTIRKDGAIPPTCSKCGRDVPLGMASHWCGQRRQWHTVGTPIGNFQFRWNGNGWDERRR